MKKYILDGKGYPSIVEAIKSYCSGPCVDCAVYEKVPCGVPCSEWARANEDVAAKTIGCEIVSSDTAKADSGKLEIDLVPPQIIRDIAEVRMYGNKKYGSSDNWKTVERRRYINALLRHTLAFMANPTSVDDESGIPHYKHMACNMAFLCEMMRREEADPHA